LPTCKHESLEYLGEQRTDDGVNTYFRCRNCNSMIVTTPERKVFSLEGLKPGMASATEKKGEH
jgi:hypothetical protein